MDRMKDCLRNLHDLYKSVCDDIGKLSHIYNENIFGVGEDRCSVIYPDEVYFGATAIDSSVSNFYPVEYNDAGASYRWTGPGCENFFYVPINRKLPKTVFIKLCGCLDTEILDGLNVCVDAQRVDATIGQDSIAFILPPRVAFTVTEIVLILPYTIRPSSRGLGSDDRSLGVAIEYFKIEGI